MLSNGLYQLDLGGLGVDLIRQNKGPNHAQVSRKSSSYDCNVVIRNSDNNTMLWHYRLGHPCDATLKSVCNQLNVGIKTSFDTFCDD